MFVQEDTKRIGQEPSLITSGPETRQSKRASVHNIERNSDATMDEREHQLEARLEFPVQRVLGTPNQVFTLRPINLKNEPSSLIMAERNEEYYIDGPMTVIRVEHKLFRIPQHVLLNSSSVFHDMLLPKTKGGKPDGSSVEQPLVLEGIKASGFASLLKCIYPLTRRETLLKLNFLLEEWKEVLQIATAYEMTEAKAFIVDEMNPLLEGQPNLRIKLSQLYNVKSWLVPGLHELVRRNDSLSEGDIKDIGIPYAVKIMWLREGGYNPFVNKRLGRQYMPSDINDSVACDCLGL